MLVRFLFSLALIFGLFGGGAIAQQSAATAQSSTWPQEAGSVITRDFKICPAPESWGTSAHYLMETARCAFGESEVSEDLMRVAMIEDIYIKSWSFAIINKVAFWLSILLAILVLVWPSLVAMLTSEDGENDEEPEEEAEPETEPPAKKTPRKRNFLRRAVTASSVQTSITALAALAFAFYAHYKGNQMASENLMRRILYADTLDQTLIDEAIQKIREMDAGFGFASLKAFQDN